MNKIEQLKLVPVDETMEQVCRFPNNKEIMEKINEVIEYINSKENTNFKR